MDVRARVDGPWLALALIGLGGWFLIREVFGLGAWFAPATLGALALACLAAYLTAWRRQRWLAGAWLLGGWALYLALDAYLPGGLPFPFFFAFLGLAFLGLYACGARPAFWPLLPASLLLGVATFLWMLSVGLTLLPYLLPLGLVGYGIWLLARQRRRP